MEEALKERIKGFELDDDEIEYILSKDIEILTRLASITKDDVLREIVYSLIDESVRKASYSDEVILTFINACVCNFAYETSIFEVLAVEDKQNEEEIIYELKLLARAKDKEKIRSIIYLYQIKDLPLKNKFAEVILTAKFVDSGEEIAIMVTNNLPNTRKNPYYYLSLSRVIANINKGPELTKEVVRNVIDVAENEWVIKNSCLDEVISKFLGVKQYFHSYGLCQLFRCLDKDSSIEQIETIFKGADLILQCDKEFQAKTIWKYFKYCLKKNITPDFGKAKTFLNIKKDNTSTFVDEVLEEDSSRSTGTISDTIDILNNSRDDYNFEYATALLKYPSNLEYRLSAAQIINEVTEEEKIHILGFILGEENPYSLEIAAIGNTLYDKGELETLKLLNHNHILNEMGVSILMARIIGKATDYNYDVVALYEILNKKDNKEKVINALMKELRSDIVSNPSLVADILNQVLGTVINANFELVGEEENSKKNQSVLKRVFTKFKKNKNKDN